MPCVRTVWTLVAVAALAACGRHRAKSDVPPTAEWVLRVENQHWLDVRVSVIHDGQTTPVGTVTATQTVSFLLSPYLLGQGGEIRLGAHAVGGRSTLTTETLRVARGQQVVWTLERSLNRSSVAIW